MRRRIALGLAASALVVVPSAAGWSWPVVGQVVQTFNFDRSNPYAAGQHRGIDIAAPPGTTIVAPAGGTVTFAGTVPTSGKSISILSGAYSDRQTGGSGQQRRHLPGRPTLTPPAFGPMVPIGPLVRRLVKSQSQSPTQTLVGLWGRRSSPVSMA